MFDREINKQLESWSVKPDRKPLVLRGARQVGKTTLVKNFAKKYDCFIYLNLEKEDQRRLFVAEGSFAQKLEAIFFLSEKRRNPGHSVLIFIDEIQYSPEAVQLLRYFYEESPEIHVIVAGSLLETMINRHISFPVGRVEYLAVRPCSFTEFLNATGNQTALEVLQKWPFPEYAHSQLSALFNRYALIGGMPAVLASYAKENDLIALRSVYLSLIAGYSDDVEKYAGSNSSVKYIRHILRTGFGYTCQRIKFERFGESDYRSREVSEAFQILEKTMLLELVYPTTSAQVPLLPNFKKSPRLHWLDTGLVNFAAGVQQEVFGVSDLRAAWKGAIAEHIVGQELIVNDTNILSHRTFWVREAKNSNAEVDFIINCNGLIIPIEVKSDSGNTLKSLHLLMDQLNHDLAVRVWDRPFKIDAVETPAGKKFRLLSIPYYLVYQIPKIIKNHL